MQDALDEVLLARARAGEEAALDALACRPLTPRFQEMSQRRPKSVFAVNVADDLPLARALGVMATPSIVEVANGIIIGYHVGRPGEPLMARWA
jgi:hypothetical protein